VFFFPFQLSDSNSGCIAYPFHMCYMSNPYNLSWCEHFHNFRSRVKIMKLLIFLFSLTYHCFSFESHPSPQHPVPRHPQSMFALVSNRNITPLDLYNLIFRTLDIWSSCESCKEYSGSIEAGNPWQLIWLIYVNRDAVCFLKWRNIILNFTLINFS
jgi:hypothetical protein